MASLFVGTLLGIMSARRASGLPLTQLLAGARHGTRNDAAAHHTLVVGKVCLAFVLLAVGSTFWRGLERVADSDFGFSPDTVSYVRLSLPESAYPDMAAISTFHARLLGALEQSHLLQGSSIAQSIPIVRSYRLAYRIEGDVEGGEDERTAQYYAVSPAYFDLLGIRLLSRAFGSTRTARSPNLKLTHRSRSFRSPTPTC
ncbi:MAG: hypothetical protein IPO08_05210 [Xanthomonadales bacterium]|nr:hypothetical protein [Xanthomonadales bacterium]